MVSLDGGKCDIFSLHQAREIDGVKIFHYAGGLSFASRSTFKDILVRKTGFDAAAVLRRRAKLAERGIHEDEELLTKCLILDFSCLTFVDPAGVDFLRSLQADCSDLSISMYITGCSGPVYEVMKKCDTIEKKDNKFLIFPTVHDAVLFARASVLNKKDV